jgi:pimeloyl-ACP methyl ester carboxylesterase
MKDSQGKSTNVRFKTLRLGMRTLAAISEGAAAAALEQVFLRTRRRPIPERERAWLAGAKPVAFESRGKTLAGWTWGLEGPTVLLAHGWEGRGSQMGAFAAPLVEAGYRVVAFDAPGHGRSPGRRSSLVEMADAIRDADDRFGPTHAVVGHSAGAAAAAIALSRGVRASRIVFIAPPVDLGSHLKVVARWLGLPDEVARRTRERIERRFRVRWESLELVPIARTMTAPLLLVHDAEDREVPIDGALELERAWPGARLEKTSGLGHRRVLRDPNVVESTVRFLRADVEGAREARRHVIVDGGRDEAIETLPAIGARKHSLPA